MHPKTDWSGEKVGVQFMFFIHVTELSGENVKKFQYSQFSMLWTEECNKNCFPVLKFEF